jgi:hypothetical protein
MTSRDQVHEGARPVFDAIDRARDGVRGLRGAALQPRALSAWSDVDVFFRSESQLPPSELISRHGAHWDCPHLVPHAGPPPMPA